MNVELLREVLNENISRYGEAIARLQWEQSEGCFDNSREIASQEAHAAAARQAINSIVENLLERIAKHES